MNKIAFIFPGQGAQYSGMGKELYENFPEAKDIFMKADESLGFSLSKMCFEGSEQELSKTENTQPCLLTVSAAVNAILNKEGIYPSFCAGLSLGEYSAHVASETISFSEAVSLVKKRGRFMQEAVEEGIGTMAAVMGLPDDMVIKACSEAKEFGVVEAVNFNCTGQVVIAGEIKAVEEACAKAKALGAKRAKTLKVSAPFHSSMMAPAAERLKGELNKIEFKDFKVPVFTNLTGEKVPAKENIPEILYMQVKSPVLWTKTIKNMISEGVDIFIEAGPGKTLSSFVKKIDSSENIKIYNAYDSLTIKEILTNINV